MVFEKGQIHLPQEARGEVAEDTIEFASTYHNLMHKFVKFWFSPIYF